MNVSWLSVFSQVLEGRREKSGDLADFYYDKQVLVVKIPIAPGDEHARFYRCTLEDDLIRDTYWRSVVHRMSNAELQLLFECFKKHKKTQPYYYIQRKKWREARGYDFQ